MPLDRDLATLNALAQALSGSLDLEQVLHTALDTVAELLALDTGWVWLLDEDTGAPMLAARGVIHLDRGGRFRVRERTVLRYYARTLQHLLAPRRPLRTH
jgi:GAF domain-containing protein